MNSTNFHVFSLYFKKLLKIHLWRHVQFFSDIGFSLFHSPQSYAQQESYFGIGKLYASKVADLLV
ncbi:MAG: hypothetical protein LBS25_00490, partial [Candidatus Symbiothrix sp.]|nr:hypothetical protein [Candidatus Symbiothrix sp.]